MPQLTRKILWHLNHVLNNIERLIGRSKLFSMPGVIYIEPTTACNLRCIYCSRTIYHKTKDSFLKKELFERLVNIIPTYTTVYLSGLGEAFLHPDIIYFTKALKKRDIKTCFFTNGTLLTPYIIDQLIEIGCDEINFSVDSINPAKYKKFRKGNIKTLIKAIEYYSSKKNRKALTISSLLINGHENEIKSVMKWAKKLQTQMFYLLIPQIVSPKIEYILPIDINAEIKKIKSYAHEIGLNISTFPDMKKKRYCNEITSELTIMSNGDIYSCHFEKFHIANVENILNQADKLGIKNSGKIMRMIWNSEKMVTLRKVNRRAILCEGCVSINPERNIFINSFAEYRGKSKKIPQLTSR